MNRREPKTESSNLLLFLLLFLQWVFARKGRAHFSFVLAVAAHERLAVLVHEETLRVREDVDDEVPLACGVWMGMWRGRRRSKKEPRTLINLDKKGTEYVNGVPLSRRISPRGL